MAPVAAVWYNGLGKGRRGNNVCASSDAIMGPAWFREDPPPKPNIDPSTDYTARSGCVQNCQRVCAKDYNEGACLMHRSSAGELAQQNIADASSGCKMRVGTWRRDEPYSIILSVRSTRLHAASPKVQPIDRSYYCTCIQADVGSFRTGTEQSHDKMMSGMARAKRLSNRPTAIVLQ
jgi:hypothetical protein